VKVHEPTREGVIVKFRVEMKAEELDPYFVKAINQFRKHARIDGFRPGKVPMSIIEKRYGESIRYDSIEDIISEIYPKALAETTIAPIAPGTIEEVDYKSGGDLTFTAVAEVQPEVKVENWKGLKVQREVVKITEEDLDRHIEHLRRQHAIITPRGEDAVVEEGDLIKLDLKQTREGDETYEESEVEERELELGDDELGHGSDTQFIGMKPGETREINTHEHQHDDNDNPITVDVVYQATLKGIQKIELPELNDDFVTQLDEKYSTFEEYRAALRDHLKEVGDFHAGQRLSQMMIDAVIEANPVDLPPSLVEETLNEMVKRKIEEYGKLIPENILRDVLKKDAENQLRWFYIQHKLIEDLHLEVSKEEIDEEIVKYSEGHEVSLETLREQFKEEKNHRFLENEILSSKLMKALTEGMDLEDHEVDFLTVLRRH